VLARLRALIRRASGQVTPAIRIGALVLDPRGARATVNGVPIKLTSHEVSRWKCSWRGCGASWAGRS